MRPPFPLAIGALLLSACTSGAGVGGARSTDDARVRSLRGQVPPELAADARWLGAPPTSLAALRGRVVFVQFAFPT
jgi:hypothetical protein